MERCNLHRRIAYAIVARASGNAQGLVFGMMCATGFVSMWVQNTSTTLMMLPVALSVATIVAPDTAAGDRDAKNFASAIILCVAYAANIGGLGTLVGTAPNAMVAGFMQQNYGETISFAQWLAFGIADCAAAAAGRLARACEDSHSRSGSDRRRLHATGSLRRARLSGRCRPPSGA